MPQVRVIDQTGVNLGIIPVRKALQIARDAGLDLVEVSPQVKPPVCRIMDYAKFRYEQKQKRKQQKHKKPLGTKHIRFSPVAHEHDVDTKIRQLRKFLEKGQHVQLDLQFKRRQIAHKDQGFDILRKVIEAVSDIGEVERDPKLEGRRLIARLSPKRESR